MAITERARRARAQRRAQHERDAAFWDSLARGVDEPADGLICEHCAQPIVATDTGWRHVAEHGDEWHVLVAITPRP